MANVAPAVNSNIAYVSGANVSWLSNTTLSVSAGACLDSTGAFDIITPAATVNTGVVGVNGLDSGVLLASKVYYLYAIACSANTSQPAYILSLSASAPTLPFEYDLYKMVGVAITDGSVHFIKINQSGDKNTRVYSFDTLPAILTAGTETDFTTIALGAYLPVQQNIMVNLEASYTPAVAANVFMIRASGSSSTASVSGTGVVAAVVQKLSINAIAKLATNVPNIEYKVTASDALTLSIVSFTHFI